MTYLLTSTNKSHQTGAVQHFGDADPPDVFLEAFTERFAVVDGETLTSAHADASENNVAIRAHVKYPSSFCDK